MRAKAREYGVVYVPNPGETPSPEEFSISGQITEQGTGNPLFNAFVRIIELDLVVATDIDGNFFMPSVPAGTYTLEVGADGYVTQNIPDVVIEEDVVGEANFELEVAV